MESQLSGQKTTDSRVQSLLSTYNSDSDNDDANINNDNNREICRDKPSSSDEDTSDDEDIHIPFADKHKDDDDDEINDEVEDEPVDTRPVKTKGELDIDELPPIQELNISVSSNKLRNFGSVISIVEQLVVIQSIRGTPALNLDSVLFLVDGSPVGEIFDVFGSVNEPLYSIRFNNSKDIIDKNLRVGLPIYYMPAQPGRECPKVNGHNVTDYVFVNQLKQAKGSDASWTHDNEPPDDVRDYSDDDDERRDEEAKRRRKRQWANN